jgi:peptidoglycan/xylan/chitin deacetylase (PgdA/CDA1 family)
LDALPPGHRRRLYAAVSGAGGYSPSGKIDGGTLFAGETHMKIMWNCFWIVTAFVGTAAAQNSLPKVTVTRWPQDRAAAISLTFDDGINTHLDVVGPVLKKHHLNGTFFVATGLGPWEKRKPEWKQLAQQGNELANHTVHHPCLLAEITPHSQDYTPEMMEREVMGADQEITQLLDRPRGLTFAYPCGNMSFGKPLDEVKNAALYMRYVSEHAFGARGVGVRAENPDELNVLDINDLGPTAGKGFLHLLQLAEPALQGHNWGVYCFHGVGGDWLSITPEALDELTGYLERHSEIWIGTFGDVLRYIQERKAASIEIKQYDNSTLTFIMHWPMDKKIYDLPLTLKVEIPAVWSEVRLNGDGKQLSSKIVGKLTETTILADIAPQTNVVTIAKAR